jgi:uncharacterized protein (TIGR02996 family)
VTDRDALLRAICDDPDDDAPRLVYADWLDEHGDPRQAEFIRLQIALNHLSDQALRKHPDADRLLELGRDLKKWRYVLGDWTKLSPSGFRRGFNTQWAGHILDFMAAAPSLWRLGPISEINLYFEGRRSIPEDLLVEFRTMPILRNMKRLYLDGPKLTDDWVEVVVSAPAAEHWVFFELYGARLTDRSCWALAGSRLTGKATVSITAPSISDEARMRLARAFGHRQSVGTWM